MRVLYDNKLEVATSLTMTNLDNDSYASNLYHPYLELATICKTATATLSRYLPGVTVNAISIGYHNCTTAVLKLYDSGWTVLLEKTITLTQYDNIYYLDTAITGVDIFTIDFTSATVVKVGYAYVGEYLQLPRFDAGSTYKFNLNSKKNVSSGGQTYGCFFNPLRSAEVSWTRITNAERQNIITYATMVQTSKPHMIDLFYEAHEEERPLYCTIDSLKDFSKRVESGFYYGFGIAYMEAR